MKWLVSVLSILVFSTWMTSSIYAEEHAQSDHKKENHDEHGKDEHADHDEGEEDKHADGEKGHKDHDEEEEEEASSSVGLDKGIIAKSENGIQLAPDAMSTFDLRTIDFTGSPFRLLKSAIVDIKDEKSVFRLRDGWYKRVHFKTVRSDSDNVFIESSSLKAGDKIVIQSTGFLRMAEVAAEGGAAHGHSH